MKNITLAIFTTMILLVTSVTFAEEIYIDGVVSTDADMEAKDYQKVADFYGFKIIPEQENSGSFSKISSYAQTSEGEKIIYEVHWFSDGLVATKMNGPSKGEQIIIINGQVFDKSPSPYRSICGDEFIYKYSWGKVNIWPGRCDIYRNTEN
jgi:hypothetical protein